MPAKLIGATLVTGLLLAACSPQADESPATDEPPAAEGSPGTEESVPTGSTLEQFTGEQMCDLLPAESVEQAFGVVVSEAEGESMAKAPFTIVSCRYSIDFTLEEIDTLPPSFTTSVSLSHRGSETEALDKSFTDTDDDVAEYESIDGLGDVAAFGPDPLLGGEGSKLVVLFEVNGERHELNVEASPEAGLEQLEPLADELFDGLPAALAG